VNSNDVLGLGINQGGDIVGQEASADGTPRAVAWRRGGRTFDLGTVQDHYRSHAVAVNDNLDRLAVGWSTSATTGRHAVIWKLPAGDDTPPVITASVQGTLGSNGWYKSDVQVTWTVSDPESAIPTQVGCGPVTISADNAGVPLTCSATNAADLTSTETVVVKRDATAPLIAYEGNAGSYTVDQTIAITCSASDAGSGIASNTCQSINADALSLGVGIHTYSATATDQAGNSASATATVTVNLTLSGIAQLTRRYSSNVQTGDLLARLLIMAEHFREHRNSLAAELALRASCLTPPPPPGRPHRRGGWAPGGVYTPTNPPTPWWGVTPGYPRTFRFQGGRTQKSSGIATYCVPGVVTHVTGAHLDASNPLQGNKVEPKAA
jgi:hypothetical protein